MRYTGHRMLGKNVISTGDSIASTFAIHFFLRIRHFILVL